MKCVSVYTSNFEQFSDLFESIIAAPIGEDEETTIDGVMINGSGDVPAQYIDRMKNRPEVVVMKDQDRNITILQHDDVFEIIMEDEETG